MSPVVVVREEGIEREEEEEEERERAEWVI